MPDAELLAAIRAHPDDDAPRLVYADWLQERDDPRGEYIALACRDTRGDKHARARLELLERTHGAAWRAHLPAEITSSDFVRGFIGRVALPTVADLLRLAAPLAALAPVPQQILLSGRARGAISADGTRLAVAESASADETHEGTTTTGRWVIRAWTIAGVPLRTHTRAWASGPWLQRGFLRDLRFTPDARAVVLHCLGEPDEVLALSLP